MSALTDLTVAAALDGLARGDFTSRELTDAHLAAMGDARGLNAFITETPEQARAMADASDARRRKGEAGALEGIPVAIKDLFCTDGVLTTAGSHILDGFKPPYESTVTGNMWRAGAVMLGKTNLDEFGMGSSTTASHYGPTENPWRRPGDNRPLVPGGSVHSDTPASRFVILDGQLLREGDSVAPGLVLLRIEPRRCLLGGRGRQLVIALGAEVTRAGILRAR